MNNNAERMLRIKARSQQILISRKRMYRRIVSLCIPLLVCGVAVLLLYKNNGASKNDGGSEQQLPQSNIQDVISDADVVLRFESEKCNVMVNNKETVAAVKALLSSYFDDDQLIITIPGDVIAEDDGDMQAGISGKKESLVIRFSKDDVIETSYVLTGNELECQQTGITIRLSEAQVEKIRRYIQ